MSLGESHTFGSLRGLLWPIYRYELKKIIPMIFILFFIGFNYTIVRTMKDALLVTAAGAEVIPFVKVWIVLPSAVFLTLFYTWLCGRFSQERVFYIIVSLFLLCFAFFGFVLYPHREQFTPTSTIDWLSSSLPIGMGGFMAMFENWTLTFFYVLSELWSSMVLTVLFWGFANEVTKLSEARRFYSILPIWLNIASIIASQFSNLVTSGKITSGDWDESASLLVIMILISGIITMSAFFWANRYVFIGEEYTDLHAVKKLFPSLSEKKGKRLSFRESFNYVSNSKYLICIATIVISYNLAINLVEVVWKDQLLRLYPDPSNYNTYMNNVTTCTSIVSFILALSIPTILKRFDWTFAASITPLIMLITSFGFFFFLFFSHMFNPNDLSWLGDAPLTIAVFFGAAQNCLSKGSKYSLFDATKEMTYIPLSHESKLKGKAAIDGVGSRLGKSGGSLIHLSLLMIFITVSSSAPYVALILFAAILFWLFAIRSLGTQFSFLIREKEASLDPESTRAAAS